MLKLAAILLAMAAWGAWLVWQDKWGVTSLVPIPAFAGAIVIQAMVFRLMLRAGKDDRLG